MKLFPHHIRKNLSLWLLILLLANSKCKTFMREKGFLDLQYVSVVVWKHLKNLMSLHFAVLK